MGSVPYRGVLYEGKHEPLVTPETWHEVQRLLTAKNYAGEKQRKHLHYLKGSIYCGQCGSRLIVHHATGKSGGVYSYFICVGRQQKRSDCKQRALKIEKVEAAVADYYATVQLPELELARLRSFLGDELAKLRTDADRDQGVQVRRLRGLEAERKKLLDAYYAEAIQLDMLKSEQDRLATQIASAEGRLAEVAADFKKAETNLGRALTRIGDCRAAYQEASGRLKRQFNMAFFRRLLLSDDGTVSAELAEPFDTILGDDLRRAAVAQADRELRERVEQAIRQRAVEGLLIRNELRPPEQQLLVGAGWAPAPSRFRGSRQKLMVRAEGLEPTRASAHRLLRPACLPIPPRPRALGAGIVW
jgi:site-specific DNA recombinase